MENCCSICLNVMEEEGRLELDCHHTFHQACILQWFRSPNNSSCPLCRAEPELILDYCDVWDRYKLLRRFSRSKDAPVKLKRCVKNIKVWEGRVKERTKEFNEYKNDPEVKKVLKKHSVLQHKQWSSRQKLYRKKRCLGMQVFEGAEGKIPFIIKRSNNYY